MTAETAPKPEERVSEIQEIILAFCNPNKTDVFIATGQARAAAHKIAALPASKTEPTRYGVIQLPGWDKHVVVGNNEVWFCGTVDECIAWVNAKGTSPTSKGAVDAETVRRDE
jgi:hypothetical protein